MIDVRAGAIFWTCDSALFDDESDDMIDGGKEIMGRPRLRCFHESQYLLLVRSRKLLSRTELGR